MNGREWRGRRPHWIFILTHTHLMNNWEAVDRQHCCCVFSFSSFFFIFPPFQPGGRLYCLDLGRIGRRVRGVVLNQNSSSWFSLLALWHRARLRCRFSWRAAPYQFIHRLKFSWFDAPSYADLKSQAYTSSAISSASPCQLAPFITPIGAVYDVKQVITYDSV